MKKGEIVSGVIENVAFPNKGIMRVEDTPVTVKGTITGQKVTALVNKKRGGKAEARLLSVDEKSPLESGEQFCPHFGICGGCCYQTMTYEGQLNFKTEQVKSLLKNYIREDGVDGAGKVCEAEFEPPHASPLELGYRGKMEFSFGNEVKDGPLVLGLHKKGSFYDIVPVRECGIIDESLREILKATEEWAVSTGLAFYHKMQKTGYFRHLLLRRGGNTGEVLVDLVTRSAYAEFEGDLDKEAKLMEEFKEALLGTKAAAAIKGILHTVNDAQADAIIDQGTTLLYGQDFFEDELLGLKFKITPFSFFQTNPLGAEVLYSTVRDYVGTTKDKVIFDLYSGTGTIGQLLAPVAKKVVGIEIVEEAVESAKINAARNGLTNCEFIAGDVLKKIDEITDKPDFIVLDPPREGIVPKALSKILAYGVENMVYVSCKPTSLAHDLEAITAAGYAVKKVTCVDMFPWTANVETVCLLSRQRVDGHIDIDLDVEKLESKGGRATYAEIKDYVKEKYGYSISSLYIAQIKDKVGLDKRLNYNHGTGKTDGRTLVCPPEKEEAIMDAFRYFNLI